MFRTVLIVLLLAFNVITQAALPSDPIQRCLDVRRFADFTTRQKMAAKEPGVLRFRFHKISSSELPLTKLEGNMNEVIKALQNQIKNCKKQQGEYQSRIIGGQQFKRQDWCLDTNKKMLAIAEKAQGDFKQFITQIKTEFDWYKSEGWPENHAGFKKGEFQFTAYYAPAAIEAHSKRGGAFLYPIYANPGVINVSYESRKHPIKAPLCGVDPLTKMMRPYCLKNDNGTYSVVPDREEINRGALNPKHIIGYVKDPNDIAFLMIQGAGSLMLDGQLIQLNYDGFNGRPRTMLGRIVQCAQDPTCGGKLDTIERCAKDPKCHDDEQLHCNLSKEMKLNAASEKRIRNYLDTLITQEKANNLRNRDQSFVFFSRENGGPYGSENITLTAHASCATDHKVIPIGMNFIYNCKNSTSWCLAQDAGGAIMGAHVDIYKGEGEQAGMEANKINNAGSLYIALPKKKK